MALWPIFHRNGWIKLQKHLQHQTQAMVKQSTKDDKPIQLMVLQPSQQAELTSLTPHHFIAPPLFVFNCAVSLCFHNKRSSGNEGFASPLSVCKRARNKKMWRMNLAKDQCVACLISALGMVLQRQQWSPNFSCHFLIFCQSLHFNSWGPSFAVYD